MAALAVAGLLAVLAPAFAANDTMQPDNKFAKEAAQGGMMEVDLGQLAAQKGASQAVKDFGQRMVTDHSKANQELMQIASQKGMSLPTALPADKKQMRDKLAASSGAEFDRMYMTHMVKDHEKDVKEFEKQAQNGKDPALRSFAEKTLPTLRQHLEMARTVAAQVGAHTGHDQHGSHGSH
jgi:putative membrane protein